MRPSKALESSRIYENSAQGRLQDRAARVLIEELNQQAFSGTLLLTLRDKKKKIWFSRGEVFRVQSNLVPELFGKMMVDRGWINEADLQTALHLQKELNQKMKASQSRRLGDWIQEIHGILPEEMESLHRIQQLRSLIQSLSWDEGQYEVHPMDLDSDQPVIISVRDILGSLRSLLQVQPGPLGALFRIEKPWNPQSQGIELSRTPLWSVLAGCQRAGTNGILSIRKQNRLFELVIKNGIPLLLYEGSFGQPRQTLIVRKASVETEKYFVGQIYKLISFLSGSAHFRTLGDQRQDRESYLQIIDDESVELSTEKEPENPNTQVTRSIKPDEELPFELKSAFLAKKDVLKRTLEKFIRFVKA